jgi:putative alpha-1,2-mannosidase
MPWGMNSWTAQTAKMGDGWQYYYNAEKIRGFKQTHQPSPWINDYGKFSIMPVTGSPKFTEKDRMSWFSHKAGCHPIITASIWQITTSRQNYRLLKGLVSFALPFHRATSPMSSLTHLTAVLISK